MNPRWVMLVVAALVVGALVWSQQPAPEVSTPAVVATTPAAPEVTPTEQTTTVAPTGSASPGKVEKTMEVSSNGETYPPLPPVAHPEGNDAD